MGIYDRQYFRDEPRGFTVGADWSAVVTLIVINAAVALVQLFIAQPVPGHTWLTHYLALQPNLFTHPWDFWQLLTYGFIHAPDSIFHVLFNMFGLFIFGRDLEGVYGKREFYKLYLSLLILSGLFYVVVATASGLPNPVIGASGAVVGIVVLFACHYPNRLIYIWGVFPVPAWILAALYIVFDLVGTQNQQSGTAHWVHLGGAAFGFLYYRTGWNLFRLWPRGWKFKLPRRGPKLRVHRESFDDEPESDDYLSTGRLQKRVDELLEKISRSGEASLTDEERTFLADASRRYQQQRRR